MTEGKIPDGTRPESETLVLCDFDGTLSIADIGYEIIKRFAAPGWQEIDRGYTDGKIGSKDAYRRIAALITASREEMIAFALSHGSIDPYFREFYQFLRSRGIAITIVSDGLDFYIDAVLKNNDLADIEFFSNVVHFHDTREITIDFPQSNDECDSCGTCKSNILAQYRLTYGNIIYIGNGYSDVCPVQGADLVFAKDILYKTCIKNGRDCVYYDSFADIKKYLERSFPFFLSEDTSI